MTRREFITLLGGMVSVFLCVNGAAQEGYYGTINGIRAFTRNSKETTAKARAAT
jgi:hypothetical protein